MNISEIPFSSIQQIRIGHWEDVKGGTGCTICLAEKGAACGVDVRGGGPASRETELLKPTAAVEKYMPFFCAEAVPSDWRQPTGLCPT